MQCVAGCKAFDGGERKHHRDCPYYPESLTKIWHDTEDALRAENRRLCSILSGALAEYTDLEGKNARLREALEEINMLDGKMSWAEAGVRAFEISNAALKGGEDE